MYKQGNMGEKRRRRREKRVGRTMHRLGGKVNQMIITK